MDVNSDKLNAFMGKMVGDFGAALNASLMLIGDKLGLYKTLAAKGPMNSCGTCEGHRHGRALCSRMAGDAGRIRLHRIRCNERKILDATRAGAGARQ